MAARTSSRKAPAARKAAAAPVVRRPRLQWVASGLGLILTLATIAVIAIEALQPARPPVLSARLVGAHPGASGWVVEVEVANSGLQAASGVEIEAVQGETTASAGLDYVAAEGRGTVFLPLPDDPRLRSPALSIKGWAEP